MTVDADSISRIPMGTSWRSSPALMAVVAGIRDGVLFLRFRVWHLGVRDRCTMSQAGRLRLTFYRIRASAIAACRISILSQCSVRELQRKKYDLQFSSGLPFPWCRNFGAGFLTKPGAPSRKAGQLDAVATKH